MIEKIVLGCGILMTIGLLFFFRSLIRKVRAESRAANHPVRKNET